LSCSFYTVLAIGLIVSQAGRRQGTKAEIYSHLAKNVITNPQVAKYIEKLLQNNCMTTFSKCSDDIAEGEIYSPPPWNTNQREHIIDLINQIAFKPIPQGLFNNSSSPEVREQMKEAFGILRTKAAQLVQKAVESAIQNKLVIHTTELKKFVRFVEDEVNNAELKIGLVPYLQLLNKHKFLKVPISNELKELNEELEFVAPFTRVHENSQHKEENWSILIGSPLLFNDILMEAKVIIHEANDLFSSFAEKDRIITTGCFSERSLQLKTCFTDLYTAYKNKTNVESNKNDDKYYFYQPEQQFKGMKQVPCTEQQPYTSSEAHTVSVPYEATENYIETQWFYKYPKNFSFTEWTPEQRCFIHSGQGEHAEYWKGGHRKTFCEPREIPLTRQVIKYKDETKYQNVIKFQTVTKYKDVPEYQEVQVKKFNEDKYNADIKHANATIDGLRGNVKDILVCMKAINAEAKQALPLQVTDLIASTAHGNSFRDSGSNDEIKELFKPLNEEWKYIEYEAQALLDYQIELAGDF